MSPLAERLARGPAVLLDGGFGTMLMARGLAAGEPPEVWNRTHPGDVTAVHRAYVEAGSDAVHANCFGGNAARLGKHGIGAEHVAELCTAAIVLARAAGPRFVIGDVGPTGEYLPPVGTGELAAWRAMFAEQGRALAEAGPDALHLETMSDLREALVALEALHEVAPGVPVLASLTFERRKRGFFTVMGDPLGPSLRRLYDAGAVAVGANCSVTSADVHDLCAEARAATDAPLVVQPNAGAPRLVNGRLAYDQEPERFADEMATLFDLGVAALGGCCGTDPRFVAALARRLRRTD